MKLISVMVFSLLIIGQFSSITFAQNLLDDNLDEDTALDNTDAPAEPAPGLVNETIKKDLKVERVEMTREEAEKIGAQMEFGHKYPDRVSIYFVGPRDKFFSAEFCGGPHVTHTGEIGAFKILKEESAGSGIRRIYGAIQ